MTSAILLSASYPAGERGDAVRPYDTADIAMAAAIVVEGALRSPRPLIFGGHPTISPIVLTVAQARSAGDRVHVFQSEHYRDSITDEVWRLIEEEHAHLHWTPDTGDRNSSLDLMRDRMLEQPILAAFFVGGMEGIADEAALLDRRQPDAVQFFFHRPGGMAARVLPAAESHRNDDEPPLVWDDVETRHRALLRGRGYPRLVVTALAEIDEELKGSAEL